MQMSTRSNDKDQEAPGKLIEVLRALSDPVRLEIVRQLSVGGDKACSSFGIDMPKSSLSHHFRVLRQFGIISFEHQGTVIMNRLRSEDLNERFPGLLTSVLAAAKK
jgi:DNA-binding transcriptional ArsR family regulator